MDYAELLCLTNFSFQLGASHPRELVERAKQLGYAALAITDECSLAGIVRAHEAAETAALPLIVGSQFRFEEGDRIGKARPIHLYLKAAPVSQFAQAREIRVAVDRSQLRHLGEREGGVDSLFDG